MCWEKLGRWMTLLIFLDLQKAGFCGTLALLFCAISFHMVLSYSFWHSHEIAGRDHLRIWVMVSSICWLYIWWQYAVRFRCEGSEWVSGIYMGWIFINKSKFNPDMTEMLFLGCSTDRGGGVNIFPGAANVSVCLSAANGSQLWCGSLGGSSFICRGMYSSCWQYSVLGQLSKNWWYAWKF